MKQEHSFFPVPNGRGPGRGESTSATPELHKIQSSLPSTQTFSFHKQLFFEDRSLQDPLSFHLPLFIIEHWIY